MFWKDNILLVQALVIFVNFKLDCFTDTPEERISIIQAIEQYNQDVGPASKTVCS